jgi:hypothetical protein
MDLAGGGGIESAHASGELTNHGRERPGDGHGETETGEGTPGVGDEF